MIKNIKYWTLVLLFNYGLAIGVHYLCRPYWFDKNGNHTGLTGFETIFTTVILPFLSVIVNYWLAKKFDTAKLFFINTAIILNCIFISAKLHFWNWADSVGSRSHPDNETLEVMAVERSIGLIVTTVGLIIVFVRLYRKRKSIKLSKG